MSARIYISILGDSDEKKRVSANELNGSEIFVGKLLIFVGKSSSQ